MLNGRLAEMVGKSLRVYIPNYRLKGLVGKMVVTHTVCAYEWFVEW